MKQLILITLASLGVLFTAALLQGCQSDAYAAAEPIYGQPNPATGFVEIEKSSWNVWNDLMPGPPPELYIQGNIVLSASNYTANLRERPSTPDTLHYDLVVRRTAGMGAQVVTTRPFRYSTTYSGPHKNVVIHLPDGSELKRKIERVN